MTAVLRRTDTDMAFPMQFGASIGGLRIRVARPPLSKQFECLIPGPTAPQSNEKPHMAEKEWKKWSLAAPSNALC